jgi:VIT1/CCC1 family predicted Fe2+/Mn2+ transporter
MLAEQGVPVRPFRPGLRTRLLAWIARHGGAATVLNLRILDEAREVKGYLKEGQAHGDEDLTAVARDEAVHAEMLLGLSGRPGEPWHRMEAGGVLRNVIYGFNDGLTANFGLVMGVLGANVHASFVLLSGLAGLVADALSMGSSGYLAAKSEQEVYEHEIAMEREEIELMPEIEAEELALLYEAKGMPPEAARQAAAQVMADPQIALREKAREELGIAGELVSPPREGVITGTATALGALIPVLPFLFGSGPVFAWTSFAVSMLSHFAVGAARSLFTGRGVFRSGIDMFLVGLGVAIVGYLAGDLLMRWLSGG